MKKQFIIAIGLAIPSLFLVACESKEKDKQITPNGKAIQKPSYAVFSSIEEYESLFSDQNTIDEKANKIATRFGTYPEKARLSAWGTQDTLYPEFLQKILNDDHVVQIGEWLIKIDLIAKHSLALNVEFQDQYKDLVSNNLSNPNILVYHLDEEILPMLASGQKSENLRVEGLFCKGRDLKDLTLINLPTGDYLDELKKIPLYVQIYSKYNPGNIYFELYTEVKSYYVSNQTRYDYSKENLTIGWDATWRVNCGTLITRGEWNTSSNAFYNKKCQYSGAKSLSRYVLESRCITNRKDGSLWESPKLLMAAPN